MSQHVIFLYLPILVTIILAIKTRKIISPLLVGSLSIHIIIDKWYFIDGWINSVYTTLSDTTLIKIVLIMGLFGSFNNLLEKSGGFKGLTNLITKYVNNQKKSLLATYILGSLVFMDDYLNNLTVASAMKNITDKFNVPREFLAYLANSLAASVCIIIPFSTWSVFYSNLLQQQEIINSNTVLSHSHYIQYIPYAFYPWITILVSLFTILGIIPLVGPMKRAFNRAQQIGQVYPESITLFPQATKLRIDKTIILEASSTSLDNYPSKGTEKSINFIIPSLLLIIVSALTNIDIVKGLLAAIVSCYFLYRYQNIMNFNIFADTTFEGFRSMLLEITLVVISFVFKNAYDNLQLAPNVIQILEPIMHSSLIPVVTFIIMGACAFFTGSFWGLSAIILPIAIPLAQAVDANIYLTAGAVFSGAAFGSQSCFFSDALILSSRASEIEPMDQALTQLPFVLLSAIITIIAYLVAGFIM